MAWRLAFDKEYYIGEARAGPGGARGPGPGRRDVRQLLPHGAPHSFGSIRLITTS